MLENPANNYMNQLQLFRVRNQVRQLIEPSNRHQGSLNWGAKETDEHIQMKLEICKYLKRMGEEYYTEAILVGRKSRCDIISADRQLIIEVVNSESEASTIAKEAKYPLPVVFVNANQEFRMELIQ